MSEHTQGPLHTGGDGTIIYDKDGWGVASATVFHGRQEPGASQENARRLVACWNACESFETEALERHGIDGVMFGTKEWVQRLYAQRDQLLAALEKFTSIMDGCCNWPDTSSTQVALGDLADEVRPLIAATKGGAKTLEDLQQLSSERQMSPKCAARIIGARKTKGGAA